jgi:DUF1365 family protein
MNPALGRARKLARRRLLDRLVIAPVDDLQVAPAVHLVAHNAPVAGQRLQVLLDVPQRHAVQRPDIRFDQPSVVLGTA